MAGNEIGEGRQVKSCRGVTTVGLVSIGQYDDGPENAAGDVRELRSRDQRLVRPDVARQQAASTESALGTTVLTPDLLLTTTAVSAEPHHRRRRQALGPTLIRSKRMPPQRRQTKDAPRPAFGPRWQRPSAAPRDASETTGRRLRRAALATPSQPSCLESHQRGDQDRLDAAGWVWAWCRAGPEPSDGIVPTGMTGKWSSRRARASRQTPLGVVLSDLRQPRRSPCNDGVRPATSVTGRARAAPPPGV